MHFKKEQEERVNRTLVWLARRRKENWLKLKGGDEREANGEGGSEPEEAWGGDRKEAMAAKNHEASKKGEGER